MGGWASVGAAGGINTSHSCGWKLNLSTCTQNLAVWLQYVVKSMWTSKPDIVSAFKNCYDSLHSAGFRLSTRLWSLASGIFSHSEHRTLMLGDNVIMSQFTTKMLHGVLPSSFIWVSLSGFMHRLGLVCCPTTKS